MHFKGPEFWLSVTFLLVIVAVYIWDAYAMAIGANEKTVSILIHEWSVAQPILPFVVGVLVGHLFW